MKIFVLLSHLVPLILILLVVFLTGCALSSPTDLHEEAVVPFAVERHCPDEIGSFARVVMNCD